jgi:hypothetical protein
MSRNVTRALRLARCHRRQEGGDVDADFSEALNPSSDLIGSSSISLDPGMMSPTPIGAPNPTMQPPLQMAPADGGHFPSEMYSGLWKGITDWWNGKTTAPATDAPPPSSAPSAPDAQPPQTPEAPQTPPSTAKTPIEAVAEHYYGPGYQELFKSGEVPEASPPPKSFNPLSLLSTSPRPVPMPRMPTTPGPPHGGGSQHHPQQSDHAMQLATQAIRQVKLRAPNRLGQWGT